MNCTFCGKSIPKGTGVMYVKKDAKIFYFCSTKCEKNQIKLGHKARTTKWTNEFAKIKEGLKK